eukprot:5992129-Pyramimonas_sp.AAC.1
MGPVGAACKRAARRPKRFPGRAKRLPRRPKRSLRRAQCEDTNRPFERTAPSRPRMAQIWLPEGPRSSQNDAVSSTLPDKHPRPSWEPFG